MLVCCFTMRKLVCANASVVCFLLGKELQMIFFRKFAKPYALQYVA